MRRLSLSTKLFAAALPLVLAVGALLALTVRNDLREVDHAERGADLGAVWTPLMSAITAVEQELVNIPPKPSADTPGGIAEVDPEQQARLADLRRQTDQSLNALGESVAELDAAEASRKHITQSRTDMSGARRAIDMAVLAPGMSTNVDPIVAYNAALRELVSIGQLLPAESGDTALGRELLAVVKLAEARVASDAVIANVKAFQDNEFDASPLATAQVRYTEIESVMNEFSAIAPEEWARQFRQSGFTTSLSKYRFQLDSARRAAESGAGAQFDLEGFQALSDQSLELQQDITESIVDSANAQAEQAQRDALVRTIIALGAVLLASLIAWLLTRSVTRRVRAVSRRANQVASEQLPALVEALSDPRGKAVLPQMKPVSTRGSDELAELAQAFNSMQSTLVEVAHEQVEVLRRGVSDIFVTMARRNRSLVDRQLAMLDEFEAECDDPDVLSNYYQLDHMATRMRRNSESLLVLANAEPKRRRVKATEIDDVVRAAISEVEDYRRIEVEALEHLQVRGNVVADLSHLLAELFDNATSFSPPDSIVRVGGRRAGDSYMLRIVDTGVGMTTERLAELNELLREPPIVGLSVEPTLGMSVVSLLAARHGVTVTLSHGSPGTTVDVLLPSSMFGPIDVPLPDVAAPGRDTAIPADPYAPYLPAEPTPVPPPAEATVAERESVVAGEPLIDRHVEPDVAPAWASMDIDLSGLRAEPSGSAPALDPTPASGFDRDSLADVPFDDEPVSLDASDDEPPVAEPVPPVIAEPLLKPISLDLGSSADEEEDEVELIDVTTEISRELTIDAGLEAPAEAPVAESGPVAPPPSPSPSPSPIVPLPTRSTAAVPPPPPAEAVPVPLPEPLPAAPVAETVPAGAATAAVAPEFDRVPAPPLTPDGLARRPVTPADAMPPSTVKVPEPPSPLLPTRTPGRGPDGPDRLAPPTAPAVVTDTPVAATSSPSALQAALTAFDSRRNGNSALPTRERNTDAPSSFDGEETASTTPSRLDPEVLRERLRAFQNEFRTAAAGGATQTDHPSHLDLGGDRR